MKVKKPTSRRKDNENEASSADSLEMKKKKLKREILELQTTIARVEKQNTDVTRFGELARMGLTLPTENAREIQTSTSVPDVDMIFAHELYAYLGFYCAKVTRNEYVFNFAGSESGDETFAVQIWSNDGEVRLGNWIMPMSVDMRKIHEKTPIESFGTVIPFLKNCKHHADCYRQRKKQFDELKEQISDTSNCEIAANPGFTLITLRLLGVHNKPKDSYVDLTIDLSYRSNETLPCAIGVDWSLRKGPSPQQENEMKSYAKFLRNQTILTGFSHMIKSTHPVYYWEIEEYADSPLELNNSSDSGQEESLLAGAKRKRKNLMDRRRRDRQLKEHWRKRQRMTSVVTKSWEMDVSTDEENVDPTIENHSSGENRTQSSTRTIDRPRSPEKSEKNAMSKTGRKSHQTKSNFAGKKPSSSKVQKSTDNVVLKAAEVEETIPASRNTKPKAIKKNPVGKTGQETESTKAGTVTARKNNPVGKTEQKSGSINAGPVTARKNNPVGKTETKSNSAKAATITARKNNAVGKTGTKSDSAKAGPLTARKNNPAGKTETKSDSSKAGPVTARKNNPAGKTETKSDSAKAAAVTAKKNNAVGKAEKKSVSTEAGSATARKANLPKSKRVGILTVRKGGKINAKRLATSTPVRK